jgi:hypothetical protein
MELDKIISGVTLAVRPMKGKYENINFDRNVITTCELSPWRYTMPALQKDFPTQWETALSILQKITW